MIPDHTVHLTPEERKKLMNEGKSSLNDRGPFGIRIVPKYIEPCIQIEMYIVDKNGDLVGTPFFRQHVHSDTHIYLGDLSKLFTFIISS